MGNVESQAPAPAGQTWPCLACTYLNAEAKCPTYCEMCRTPRYGQHRFWRLLVLQSADTGWEAYFRTVDFFKIPEAGATKAVTIPVMAVWALQESDASRDPWAAFDGSNDTMYRTTMNPGAQGDFLAVDFGAPVAVGGLRVSQYGGAGNSVTSLGVQWSDDAARREEMTWHTAWTVRPMPVAVYDSRGPQFASRPFEEAAVRSRSRGPQPTWAPSGRLASLSVDRPLAFPEAGITVKRDVAYGRNIGGSRFVTVYEGVRVALVICDAARQRLGPMDDVTAVSAIIRLIERLLGAYDAIVGRIPPVGKPYDGRVRYEVAWLEGAGGLASHGVAGIAFGPDFLADMYAGAVRGTPYLQHVVFYETMRNYVFPDQFTPVFDYRLAEGPDCWGWVNQGFVNVTGCLLSAGIGAPFEYYGKNRDGFMADMEAQMDRYLADPRLRWEDVFYHERLPWDKGSSLDNVYSGLLVKLYRRFGGDAFLQRWFRGAIPRLLQRCPASKDDYVTARDNFCLAACYSANADLTAYFERELRWPISAMAKSYVPSLLQAGG